MNYYLSSRDYYMMPDMFPAHSGQYNYHQIASARRKTRRAKARRRLR